MGFGTPPTIVALEGDYSDWAIYDTQTDATLGGQNVYSTYAIFNTDETIALFVYNGVFVKKYTIASKSLGSSILDPYLYGEADYGGPVTKSAYGKYIVFQDDNVNTVYILKDGVIVKTLTNTDLGLVGVTLRGISISRKGKYIVVASDTKWVVLVGS